MLLVFLLVAVVGDGDFWFVIKYIIRGWDRRLLRARHSPEPF